MSIPGEINPQNLLLTVLLLDWRITQHNLIPKKIKNPNLSEGAYGNLISVPWYHVKLELL